MLPMISLNSGFSVLWLRFLSGAAVQCMLRYFPEVQQTSHAVFCSPYLFPLCALVAMFSIDPDSSSWPFLLLGIICC